MTFSESLDVIAAIGVANERLADWGRQVRSAPAVRSAMRGMDIRNYASGTVIELFVDAELASGGAMTWWCDVLPADGRWAIRASVRTHVGSDQYVLKEYESTSASTGRQLAKALDDVVMVFARDGLELLATKTA
jgi:hypothetical protein